MNSEGSAAMASQMPTLNVHSILNIAPSLLKSLPLPVPHVEPELLLTKLCPAAGAGAGATTTSKNKGAKAPPPVEPAIKPEYLTEMIEQAKAAARTSGTSHLRISLPESGGTTHLSSDSQSIVKELAAFNGHMRSTIPATGARTSRGTAEPAAAAAVGWDGQQQGHNAPSDAALTTIDTLSTRKGNKKGQVPSPPEQAGQPSAEVAVDLTSQKAAELALSQLEKANSDLTASKLIRKCSEEGDLSPQLLVALCNRLRHEANTPFDVKICSTDHLCRLPALLVDEGSGSQVDDLTKCLRGMTCAALLSHSQFNVFESLSSEVLDSLLEVGLRAIRHLQRWLIDGTPSQQQSADAEPLAEAAAAAGSRVAGGRGKVSRSGAPVGGASSKRVDEARCPLLIRRQLECLRGILQGMTALVEGKGNVIGEMLAPRCEELAMDAMLLYTTPADPLLSRVVAEYASPAALILFGALCRRFEDLRKAAPQTFFGKLRLNANVKSPVFQLADGVTVGAPAAVMVVAIQAGCGLQYAQMPKCDIPTAGRVLDRAHEECRTWVGSLFQHFFCVDALKAREAKEEKDMCCDLVVRFAADCLLLLEVPEAPVADHALRSLLFAVVRSYLKPESAVQSSGPLVDKLRNSSLDMIGHTATVLLTTLAKAQAAALVASTPDVAMGLGETHHGFDEAIAQWARRIVLKSETDASEAKKGKKGSKTKGEAPRELTLVERLQCVVFTSLSRLSHLPREHGVLSAMDARQYLTALWAHDPLGGDGSSKPPLFEVAVVYDPAVGVALDPSVGGPEFYEMLHTQCHALSSGRKKSLHHAESAELMLSFVLGVFLSADEGSGWDVVRKRGMALVQQLLDVRPELLPTAWQIVQRCSRDESARVRESSAPLLAELLQKTEKLSPDNTNTKAVAQSIVSALILLVQDKSPAVSLKAIQVMAKSLESPTLFPFADPDSRLSRFIVTKLLSVFAVLGEGSDAHRQRTAIALLFGRRWFESGSVGPSKPSAIDKERSSETGIVLAGSANEALEARVATLAREFVHLATFEYPSPHDIEETHPLAQLLRVVFQDAREQHQRDAQGKAEGPATAKRTRKTAPDKELHEIGLDAQHVMERTLKHLVGTVASLRSGSRAVAGSRHQADDLQPSAVVATIHLLTSVDATWILPVLDAFLPLLALPVGLVVDTTAPGAAPTPVTESDAAQLLHAIHTARHAIRFTASLPMDSLIGAFTAVLSRYVGPYQQNILLAACGALATTIEAGRRPNTSPHDAYLKSVYVTMNYYYQRARSAVAALAKDDRNVAYALRFVFLLAEFMRQYRWETVATSPLLTGANTGAVPNHFASGEGLVENFYQLLTLLLSSCGENHKPRALSICVRGVASLGMQHPTKYLRRCEPIIRGALGSADLSAQIQGVSAIRDFLVDEERRVNAAGARDIAADQPVKAENADVGEAVAAGKKQLKKKEAVKVKEEDDDEEAHAKAGKKRASKKGAKDPEGSGSLVAGAGLSTAVEVDHNSGMSTWLMQRFGPDIMKLAFSPAVQIRSLVLDTVTIAVYQGLLTPVMYVESLVVLSTCEASLRAKANRCIAYVFDRHEEAIASGRTVTGVISAFTALVAAAHGSAADLKTYDLATDRQPTLSLHSETFRLLSKSKKVREAFLLGILRAVHQEGKLTEWCQKAAHFTVGGATAAQPGVKWGWVHEWGAHFLLYLSQTVAFLPLSKETDVLLILDQINATVDLNGESTVNFVASERTRQSEAAQPSAAPGAKKEAGGSKAKAGKGKAAAAATRSASPQAVAAQWSMSEADAHSRTVSWLKTLGLLNCLLMKRFLRKEYGITPAKLLRRMEKAHTAAAAHVTAAAAASSNLPQRSPGSNATQEFLAKTGRVVQLFRDGVLTPDMRTVKTTEGAVKALEELEAIAVELIEEDSADAVTTKAPRTSPAANRPKATAASKAKGTTAAAKGKAERKRPRQNDSEEQSSSSAGSSFPYDSSSDSSDSSSEG